MAEGVLRLNLELIGAINLESLGLAQTLGMGHEAVLKDCSIRELLLYLALRPDAPALAPDPVPSPLPQAPQGQRLDTGAEMCAELLADGN